MNKKGTSSSASDLDSLWCSLEGRGVLMSFYSDR